MKSRMTSHSKNTFFTDSDVVVEGIHLGPAVFKNKELYKHYVRIINRLAELEDAVYKTRADVVEVRHGRWLPIDDNMDAFDCSECEAMVSKRMNYCPNCGAKMDGGQDDV